MLYTHPRFIDVRMEVVKKTHYTNSKGVAHVALKIVWMHRRGYAITPPCRIKMTEKKWREFKVC